MTEVCENCTVFEPFPSMLMEKRDEQAESTASTGFAGRRPFTTTLSVPAKPNSVVIISVLQPEAAE